ncbi:hypothetical protein HU200_049007 [Digitaria exilis]|uniref:Uncharacterized protein n=1 Tax=Digitaria exilis TaxID=1010633 RepID=A0A835AUL6_9POAL|nr:hypothetical protein HU200_049007 [Digitaria exilis]
MQEEQHGDGCNLIGAIDRELSIKCLVRLSRSEYGTVASLSRDFWSLVRSGEIYRVRRLAGVVEHWIYLDINLESWTAYDPDRERWIQVPKMPKDELLSGHPQKESLAVGTNLLVFVDDVQRSLFGLFRYTPSFPKSMQFPRILFGSASVGHKAYLAGGRDHYGRVLSSAEIYDCEKKDWALLPSMNRARAECSGVFMDGKLYVIGGRGSKREPLACGEDYDFKQGSWRVIENMTRGLNIRMSNHVPPRFAVVNNELYGVDYIETNVKKYDKQNNRWITLGRWPESIASTKNGRGIGFIALERQLIIIGHQGTLNMPKFELYPWVPDGRPPVWNLIARPHFRMLRNLHCDAAVMSC